MNYRECLLCKPRPYRLFCYAVACNFFFALAGLGASDNAVEQRLNEVYTQLRHTLTPAEKEALKQEELDWLKQRGRFSSGDPRWTELTEEKIRELQARLSGASETPSSPEYVSPRGTRFQLEKLDRPVINDANRKINSGDWKLTVSGSGDEYLSLKEKIGAPSFGDSGKTEYYGAIELEAEGK
jgi:hypothetical protein